MTRIIVCLPRSALNEPDRHQALNFAEYRFFVQTHRETRRNY